MITTFMRTSQGMLTSRSPNRVSKSTRRVGTNKTIKMLKESKWREHPLVIWTELMCCHKAATVLTALPHKTQDMPPGEPSGLAEAEGIQTEEGATGKLSLFKREAESLWTLTEDKGINKRVDEEAGVWPVEEALTGKPHLAYLTCSNPLYRGQTVWNQSFRWNFNYNWVHPDG